MLAANDQEQRRSVVAVGGRTALHYGGAVPADAVQVLTAELNRVIDYPSRDMTITVEAGMRVADLQDILAAEHQRLPVDVAQAHRATIGGAIATNTSGPGRYGYGTLRDYVIGISAVDGQGRLFSAGGRVVKNVAGYDLCKLLVGSLGTLGIMTQVTLKLRPRVESRQFVILPCRTTAQLDRILHQLNTSATRPAAIEVLNPKAARQIQREARQDFPLEQFLLCLGYEGGAVETDWQIHTVTAEFGELSGQAVPLRDPAQADLLWNSLTEYQAASDDPLTFRASLPPARVMSFLAQATQAGIAAQAHAGSGIVIGHLPDRCTDPILASAVIQPLRSLALQHHGDLTVLNCDEEWKPHVGVFSRPFRGERLMRGVKAALDPGGVLSPGRMTWVESTA